MGEQKTEHGRECALPLLCLHVPRHGARLCVYRLGPCLPRRRNRLVQMLGRVRTGDTSMRRTRFVHDVLIRYDPFREGLNQRPGPQARVDGFCRTISEACLYAR